MKLKSFHVCAGIGLHAYGFQRAGVTVAGLNEIDPYCQAVLAKNFPNAWKHDDLRQLTAKDIRDNCGNIDILEGSLPCQPASYSGERRGDKDHRWLWDDFISLAVAVGARWIVTENVPGFLSLAESERLFIGLEAAGYEVQPFAISALAVGIPQERERAWIVANAVGERQPTAVYSGELSASSEENETGTAEWSVRPAWTLRPEHVDQVPRLVDELPKGLAGFTRRNALKALGNANVWQIPFSIAKGIIEIESHPCTP